MNNDTEGPRRPPRPSALGRIEARSGDDLLALLVTTLGFVPRESLVLLILDGSRVYVTARMDLDDALNAYDLPGWVSSMLARTRRPRIVLVCFTTEPEPADAVMADILDELSPAVVIDALRADGRRWWSYLCTEGSCPPEGRPYDVLSHPITAQAVFAGFEILPDRDELARRVAGPAPEQQASVIDGCERARQRLPERTAHHPALVRTRVHEWLGNPRALEPDEVAELAVLLGTLAARDEALMLINRGNASHHVDLWTQVLRLAPSELAVGPLCLLAVSAWVSGSGALLVVCVDRLEALAPQCSMLGLLHHVIEAAVPPQTWDAVCSPSSEGGSGQRGRQRRALA